MTARHLVGVLGLLVACGAPAAADEFGDHWHDGKAELDGYRLTVSRYGEERDGTAVMIFVTEPFSESKRVKVDDPYGNPDDTFNVLKLNLVRDFQTGIYDYNTMTSVFARTSDFTPAKISFSSAEWCGHVYEELVFRPSGISGRYYSYFEDESSDIAIDAVTGGIAEDNLFIVLRGLRDDYLEPGGARTVRLLPSSFYRRLAHREQRWVSADIRRDKDTAKVEVPAGEFETMVYRVDIEGGRQGVFHIESAYPHRIVRWQLAPDVEGVLTGSKRLVYWQLNKNGGEKYLKEIGL